MSFNSLKKYLNPWTLFSFFKLRPLNDGIAVRNFGIKREWDEKLLIFILRVALGITLEITKPRLSIFSIYTFFHYFTHFFPKSVRFIRLCRATHWFIAVFRFISLPLWLLALFSVVERLRQRVRALLASYVPYQPLQPSHRANPAYFDNVWSPGWCWSIPHILIMFGHQDGADQSRIFW